MATAIITLKDEDGQVNVVIEFGEDGGQHDSPAHQLAVSMVYGTIGGSRVDDEDEDEGE